MAIAEENPPASPFFKGGLIQQGKCNFALWVLGNSYLSTARSPLWKRGARGDFAEFVINLIIFSQLPLFKGGSRTANSLSLFEKACPERSRREKG
jgi:hypothetical protein